MTSWDKRVSDDDESKEVAWWMEHWVGTKAGLNLNYMGDLYRLLHSLSVLIYKMGLLIPTWTT